MSITIRAFVERDYPAILEVYNRVAPLGIHPPEVESVNALHYVAVRSESGQVVGFGIVPTKECYSFDLVVSPPWQRQGIGRLLWERFSHDLVSIGATAVEPWVREENVVGIAWLLKHGFTPTKLGGPVSLFLKDADLSRFEAVVTDVEAQGVVLTTLNCERKQDQDCMAKLHDLYTGIDAEVRPSEWCNPPTLEQFIREQDEPEAIPDAYFIAKHGTDYIGLSYLRPRAADPNCAETGNVQQCLTGVLPNYRRRGIATALKISTITFAREHGFLRILTNSSNPAMQALNAKLGFKSGPWRVYLGTL